MKIFKSIIIWSFGFICGVVLIVILRNIKTPLVEVTIKNESSFLLTKVIIHDDKLGKNIIFKNIISYILYITLVSKKSITNTKRLC